MIETTFDLVPGVYAFSCFDKMEIAQDVVKNDGKKEIIEQVILEKNVRKYRLVIPEETTITIHTKLLKPRFRKIRMDDPSDPVPHEGLLSEPRPLTLQEQIARCISQHIASNTPGVQESWEEADDFDIDDDDM